MIKYTIVAVLSLILVNTAFADTITDNEWAYCKLYASFQDYKNNPEKQLPADKALLINQAECIIKGLEEKTDHKKILSRIAQKGVTTVACCIAAIFPFSSEAQEAIFSEFSFLGYLMGGAIALGGCFGIYHQGYKGGCTLISELKNRDKDLQVKKEIEEVRDWLKNRNDEPEVEKSLSSIE